MHSTRVDRRPLRVKHALLLNLVSKGKRAFPESADAPLCGLFNLNAMLQLTPNMLNAHLVGQFELPNPV